MRTLIISEKPSVAISISKVLGATKKKDGYYEGNEYIVSWCIGHLIQMANPDAYDKKYAKWNMADLPIIPKEYKYEVAKANKKQFNILKKLMNDKEVDTVINACDAGREGESIFRLVYNQVNCKKKIKRLWISSMEDSAIKEGFDNLKDGKDYDNLFESAKARAIADWLVGMNISRLYSCLYKQNYSVGRVQTPTLYMIVKRDEEIKNFEPKQYFVVKADTGLFIAAKKFDGITEAYSIVNKCNGKDAIIKNVIKEEKNIKPSGLLDLTSLQREANKLLGFSAQQTLDLAQCLYEKKIITYPRTDSKFLTEDMKNETKDLIINLVNSNLLGENLREKYEIEAVKLESIINDKKVSDHHAIIPTN